MKKQIISLLMGAMVVGSVSANVARIVNETGMPLEKARMKVLIVGGGEAVIGSAHAKFFGVGTKPGTGATLHALTAPIAPGETATIDFDPAKLTVWTRGDVEVPAGYKEVKEVEDRAKVLVEPIVGGRPFCLKGEKLGRIPTALSGQDGVKLYFVKCKVDAVVPKCYKGYKGCVKSYNGRCKAGHDCGNLKVPRPKVAARDLIELKEDSDIRFVVKNINGVIQVIMHVDGEPVDPRA